MGIMTEVGVVPDAFWSLVDLTRDEGPEAALARLSTLEDDELAWYEDLWSELWQKVLVVDAGGSEGAAWDRAMALVMMGRAHYERALADPARRGAQEPPPSGRMLGGLIHEARAARRRA